MFSIHLWQKYEYLRMLYQECIATTPDGARHGVSRPAIKKFVDSKYHLPMNATATSQLNRAISHGTHSGDFVLPKGPSGKVKLAPKRVGEIAKKKPPSKPPMVTKARGTAKKPSVSTTKSKMPPFADEQPARIMLATRKYTSMAKRARVTPTPGRKVSARKANTKRGGAKRAFTDSSATTAKTRIATRKAVKSKKRTNK
ncbi:hypothetical protein J3R83DRAFT_1973 [Lanmaoa asiatica]|nr:hypothetical protein J3R83DRAFT_1973 [Lanmaoa asiatica]